MSIVERALQKAQQQGKGSPPANGPVAESVPDPAPAPVAHMAVTSGPHPAEREPYHRQASDDSSATSRDLKRIVEFDFDRLREAGRLPPTFMTQQIDEEMRRIKWPVLNSITGRSDVAPVRNNVVLVTSAVPAEGKTFTSLNLALSIVRDRELRVILVDGDVARPGLTPALGLEDVPGLNDVLDDPDRDVDSVIYRTTVDGLFFVPAGKWHEHSAEFFAGSRMHQVVETLSRRVGNGVIVLDSPPLLATNDAQAATRYVGQVLVVVRADHTEQRAVLDALALVDKSTPVSAVLNRVEASMVSKYYGQYYYGYGATYGSRYGRQDNTGKGSA